MSRVVAGLNGGFQALHGEFGMMGDGVVYLPAEAVRRDGRRDARRHDRLRRLARRRQSVPDDILSYRQNLTALVKDEKFNPYSRTWWGGTPPGRTDKVHTMRTGICLTRENFVAYFYGTEIAAEALAQAMIRARCKFGMHLDMNVGHTGLEFYSVAPARELAPHRSPARRATGRPRAGARARRAGTSAARRMIRGMPLMNFPRYIHREARDFFYLTLAPRAARRRHRSGAASERGTMARRAACRSTAFPTRSRRRDACPIRRDPRCEWSCSRSIPRVVARTGLADVDAGRANGRRLLGHRSVASRGHPRCGWRKERFRSREKRPEGASRALLRASPSEAAAAAGANAAMGIADEDGMLVYAESAPARPTRQTSESGPLARRGSAARPACCSRTALARARRNDQPRG